MLDLDLRDDDDWDENTFKAAPPRPRRIHPALIAVLSIAGLALIGLLTAEVAALAFGRPGPTRSLLGARKVAAVDEVEAPPDLSPMLDGQEVARIDWDAIVSDPEDGEPMTLREFVEVMERFGRNTQFDLAYSKGKDRVESLANLAESLAEDGGSRAAMLALALSAINSAQVMQETMSCPDEERMLQLQLYTSAVSVGMSDLIFDRAPEFRQDGVLDGFLEMREAFLMSLVEAKTKLEALRAAREEAP